jgi:hypothetical protein
MFADDYPQFNELSELTPPIPGGRQDLRTEAEQHNRMNHRYEALFASNRDVFDGARVLDLASHDGRWSFAALRTGAAHVTGIEVRPALIDRATAAFGYYEQDPATYRFVCGDIFETLARETFDVDVVLCFGFLYHTYRHTELMRRIHDLRPRHLIVDTMVTLARQPTLKLIREPDVEDIRSAAQDPWALGRVLVLRPSVPALELLLRSYRFEIESAFDWQHHLSGQADAQGLEGYASGKRVSVRCVDRRAAAARGWERAAAAPAPIPPPRHGSVAVNGERRVSAQQGGGWRERVNQTLARTTGYELRRASGER